VFSASSLLLLVFGCGDGKKVTDRIRTVTTIPVIQDIVENIGGEKVDVRGLIAGLENPHTYEPKASDIRAIADADLFFEIGL
jgi:ABC-type Zn uptake system ZnuABC Zn-binding protein ZnuA